MELRPYQAAFIDAAIRSWGEYKNILGVAPTGSGKCLGRGTSILMFDGHTKPVEDLRIDDLIMGPDSTPRKILSTCHGKEMLYAIKPIKGDSYIVNESHILSLKITNIGKGCIIDSTGVRSSAGEVVDICVKDYLKSTKWWRHCAKGWRTAVDFPHPCSLPKILPPYLLGIWLGDGTATTPSISKPDIEIRNYLKSFVEQNGLLLRVEEYQGKCPTLHVVSGFGKGGHACGCNKVLNELRSLNLINNKHIPHQYKTASRQDRLELIAGLIDTDGHLSSGGVDWISVDKPLADDFVFVCRSLGFAAYMTKCQKSCQNDFTGTYYRVSVSGDLSVIPNLIPRKHASARKQKKNVLLTGISIEAVGEGDYYGFEIDGDGRFLLGDFTVTHNTLIAAGLTERIVADGPVLFLADAQELVYQNADKFTQFGLFPPAVEMADSKAELGDSIVIGTTQSMARRLDKWPTDYFAHVLVDEAHRNTLGDQAQSVLNHFSPAKILGVTATPFRSDKKQLGSFYESICYEIALPDLIKQGYLSRITIKSIPMNIDLRGVRTTAGDYNDADLGAAIEPYLEQCAKALIENAPNRKTVVFLPLIETSKKFAEILRGMGVNAVHVDGKDRAALHGDWQVICNASLLTTGWDEPSVNCVYILRPTKSLVLYMQMVGRGTRIFPGKENLLLLDPLYLSDRHDLVRPAKLIAKTDEELESVQKVLDDAQKGGGGGEQLDMLEASSEAAEARHRTLVEKLKEASKRKSRTVDAVEFALAIDDEKLANYEPEVGWEMQPPSVKQVAALEKAGFDTTTLTCKGQASMLMDALFRRRDMGLATPKQVKWLIRFRHPSPWTITFNEASAYLDSRFGRKSA